MQDGNGKKKNKAERKPKCEFKTVPKKMAQSLPQRNFDGGKVL